MNLETAIRPNTLLPWGILGLVAAVGYAVAVLAYGALAVLALLGMVLFALFVQYPVLGFYTTTALLLLSGSTGIVGYIDENASMAVTLAKLCGMASLAAWLTHIIVLRRGALRFSAPGWLLSIFVAYALLSTVLSDYRSEQWPEWFRLLTLLGYFLLGVNTLNTARRMHRFVWVLAVCGGIMAATAVMQYLFPQYQVAGAEAWRTLGAVDAAYVDQESLQGEAAIRVSGRAGHSNWLAMIILLILPLNAYAFRTTKDLRVRVFILGCVALELVALLLTFTRTGLVIGAVLLLLLLMQHLIKVTPLRVFGFLFGVVLVYLVLPDAYVERVLNPKQYTRSVSVQSRLQLQESALRQALDHPVLGVGMGGFGIHFIRENSETAHTLRYMVLKRYWQAIFIGAHNMYLEIAANTGWVGLGIFLLFFLSLLWRLARVYSAYKISGDIQGAQLAAAFLVSLVGFFLCAIFLHALMQKIWWMVAAGAVALALHQPRFVVQSKGSVSETPRVAPGYAARLCPTRAER